MPYSYYRILYFFLKQGYIFTILRLYFYKKYKKNIPIHNIHIHRELWLDSQTERVLGIVTKKKISK